MSWIEKALVFPCVDDQLVGVLALPDRPAKRAVLIVVGGPQYRAGSHRQFTLLARELAKAGIAALRFDYRGMGDSTGSIRSFEHVQEDIRIGVDTLTQQVAAAQEVVIWGLCDAASAALFYAHTDPRISGLVLLNPWVRTEQGLARAQVRHYYSTRLLQRSFWSKLLSGEVNVGRALSSFVARARDALAPSQSVMTKPLPQRMEEGLRRFKGPVLFILSGADLTAQEFRDAARTPGWQSLLQEPRVTRQELAEANHTFARQDWRHRVEEATVSWVMRRPD